VAALLLCTQVAGCAPLSVKEERELGAEVDRDVRRRVVLLRDRKVQAYVRGLGEALVSELPAQSIDYQFSVVESEDLNAFALPGGHIYVHTATILRARNASELAAVLAHEIGHVAHRHVANNYRRQRNTQVAHTIGVLAAGAVAGGAAADLANLGGTFAGLAYLNSFTREDERNADRFALDLLPRVGWDPHGLVSFFRTILQEEEKGALAFLSSHPATEERIADGESALLERALPGGLATHDGGKLEIIQHRIRLLTGADGFPSAR
jgi:predicted Zn-dependent protease